MAQYVKKYNTFDVADGSGLILRLSVCMNLCFFVRHSYPSLRLLYAGTPRDDGCPDGTWHLIERLASSSVLAYLSDVKGTLCDVRYIFKRR